MASTQATVSTYKMFASNGRYIRTATMVTFPDGQVVKFTERLGKLAAIIQAGRLVCPACGRVDCPDGCHAMYPEEL